MKRIVVRLAALVTVVVLGVVTVVLAQRSLNRPTVATAEAAETASSPASDETTATPSPAVDDQPAPEAEERPTLSIDVPPPSIEYRGQIADDYDDEGDDIPPADAVLGSSAAVAPARYEEPIPSPPAGDPFGLNQQAARTRQTLADPVPASELAQQGQPSPSGGERYAEPNRLRLPETAREIEPVAYDPPQGAEPPSRYDAAVAYEDADDPQLDEQPERFEREPAFEAESRRAAPVEADPFDSPAPREPQGFRQQEFDGPRYDNQGFDDRGFDEPAERGDRPPAQLEERTLEAPDVSGPQGTGRPGGRDLEGTQIPSVSIEKIAPDEVQVGKTATFQVIVRNIGEVAARDVEVHDEVPQGTELIGTVPKASQDPSGKLLWTLGTLQPGDERTLEMQLRPTTEGEIGSVATLVIGAEASVRTRATRPELALHVRAPRDAMIDSEVSLTIEVANTGSGAATGVVIEQPLPTGLEHPAGSQLEYEIGELAPGERREIELMLLASAAGPTSNRMALRADGDLRVESSWELEVVAPALEVTMQGPKRRFLERAATYTFAVANPGTAPARDVELVTYLPPGLEFVEANNYGHYDAEKRAVYWSLEELPVNEVGNVTLTAIPVEPGEQRMTIEGRASQGLSSHQEELILVEGVPAILFQVVDVEDPIEAGGETSYEIRVVNQGTSSASNIQLRAILPDEMKAISAEGPTRHLFDGQVVSFDSLARLAPKADTTYRIRVQAMQPGDLRIRVQLLTDELRTPVTKEESTRVFSVE